MDKEMLLRAFKSALSNVSGTVMSDKCKLSSAPLSALKKLDMVDACVGTRCLNREVCYQGRVMYAKICTSAALPTNNAVICLVEQESNHDQDHGSAILHIFNALTTSSKSEDAEVFFPADSRVAIKEPLCFSSTLQVSSPASVEFLGITKSLSMKPIGRLLKEANTLLDRGRFVLADLYYTQVMNIRKESAIGEAYGALEKLVFSKRAEARLALGRYEEAFVDAEAAVNIPGGEKQHARSLWCKGRSLSALQEHKQAFACFESAAKLSAEDEVLKDLEKSATYLLESQGDYDVTDYVLGRKVEPDCSDYFGPVEVKMTPDGRGRGVYLTQDVKRGDLLIVCNPTAYSKTPKIENADRDLFVELIRSCSSSNRPLYHIYAMADATEMKTVPDMDRFKCNVGKVFAENGELVDLERIRRVGHRCGFTTSAGDVWIAGVWASSGFFNHSCIPNASKVCFGQVMFIRAARNMKAGDEVMLSYMESTSHAESLLLAPLAAREVKCKRLDFECSCKRCVLERENKDLLAGFRNGIDRKMEKMVEEVLDLEKRMSLRGFGDEEKNCIRAALVEVYSAVCVLKHPELPSVEEYLRILHEIAPGNFETLSKMAVLYHVSGQCGAESREFLYEEVVALFGEQKREILDGVIRQVIAQARLVSEIAL